jgi:Tol biopolymer transport system component
MDHPTSSTLVPTSTTSGPLILDTQPELSQDGNLIVYSSNHSGSFEIYKRQLGQNVETRLTFDGKENFQPTLSHDGQYVAYYSKKDNGIFRISVDGRNRIQLTNFGSAPKWSKDDDKIVFQSIGDPDLGSPSAHAGSTILVCTVSEGMCNKNDQKNITEITQPDTPKGAHLNPVWSPDNERIAFVSFTYSQQQIWSTSASGRQVLVQSTPQAKTNQPEEPGKKQEEDWADPFARVLYPVYSKDPSRYGLYFVSGTTVWWQALSATNHERIGEPERITETTGFLIRGLSVSVHQGKTTMVYGVQSLTSNLWNLKLSDLFKTDGKATWLTNEVNIRNSHPAFSRDGSQLAFMRSLQGWDSYISTMNADGSNVETKPSKGATLSWHPDGSKVLFVFEKNIYFYDLHANRATKVIFPENNDVEYARLSNKGKLIAYTRYADAGSKIQVYDIDKKKSDVVATGKGLGFPVWSPDDEWIAYQQTENDVAVANLMLTRINPGAVAETLRVNEGRNWPHSFSPDGDKIAYVSDKEGVWNVYWYSRGSRTTEKLTTYNNLNSYVRYPTWLPTGKGDRIIYEYAETTGSIWLADLK